MSATDMSWMLGALQPGGLQKQQEKRNQLQGCSSAFLAASKGDHIQLRKILETSQPPTAFHNGWLPLHAAASKGHLACLKVLHESQYGASILGALTDVACGKRNALHLAAKNGHVECVRFICSIAGGAAAVSLPDGASGATPLHLAVHGGHEDTCRLLVNIGGVDSVTVANDESMTPLMVAAASGHLRVFRFLVDVHIQQSNIAPDDTGKFCNESSACVAMLSTTSGQTLLHKASAAGHTDIVEDLLNRFYPRKGLFESISVEEDESESIDEEIDGGGNPDCRFPGCEKPALRDTTTGQLLSGVANGFCSTVHAAVVAADEALYDFEEETSKEELPQQQNRVETKKGKKPRRKVDIDAPTTSGATALHLASQGGHSRVAWLLMAHGADPRRVTEAGQTPLHKAAYEGHCHVVEMLILACRLREQREQRGRLASKETTDEEGNVPVPDGNENVHGWSLGAKDREGHTVLHCAAAGGRHRVVDMIFEAMAEEAVVSTLKGLEAAAKLMQSKRRSSSGLSSSTGPSNDNAREVSSASKAPDEADTQAQSGRDWPTSKEWLYATLSNGEDAAILATKSGFRDLASKITRHMYIDTRKSTLLEKLVFGDADFD